MKIEKISDNRVNFHLDGPIDAEGMRRVLDEILEATSNMSHGKMLYTIGDFSMPTASAIAVEFSYLPQLFGLLPKIDRCALLTDVKWIAKSAEIEGALIPGIKIKSFALSEKDRAEAWLAE